MPIPSAKRKSLPFTLRGLQSPIKADYPSFAQWSNKWLLPSSDSIIKDRAKGRGLRVYDEVRRDDQVQAGLSQLFGDITSRDWVVAPGGDKRIDRLAAESIERQLKKINWDEITTQMAEAVFWGYSIAEAEYTNAGDEVELVGIYPRRRTRFHWNYDGEPLYRAFYNAYGVPLIPNKYWYFSCGGDNADDPNGLGLAHWLYWPTFFKKNGYRWWILFLEKYAKPHRHGTSRPNATPEELEDLQAALEAFGEDDWTIAPEGNLIQLIEASRSGGADYKEMVEICNQSISKITTGGTMTMDDGSSHSQAQVHADAKLQKAKALSDILTNSFSQSIGKWLTEWNYPGAAIPTLYRRFEEDADLSAEADKDTKLLSLGIRLKPEAVVNKYGDEYEVEDQRPISLAGDQVTALSSMIGTAQQGSWKPELVRALLVSSFPLLPEEQVSAIVENLGTTQPAGGQPGEPNQPPAKPLDPAEADKLLDAAKFAKQPEPLDPDLDFANALLDRLNSIDLAQFKAAPAAVKERKKKKCKEGNISCGFTCISGKKVCRIDMIDEQKQIRDELLAKIKDLESKPAAPEIKPGYVGEIDTSEIAADPKRFQYKIIGELTKTGEVGSLSGVKDYDPNLAGIVQVWRDPADGQLYIVNGHNRLALAKRAGAEKVAARVIDAPDAATARSIGALTNIAEGRGTPLDAAKFFRDTGLNADDLKAKNIPLREQIGQKGLAIASLDKTIFDKVVMGDISENRAAIIGGAGLKPEQQRDLLTLADKKAKGKSISDEVLQELVDDVKASSTKQGGGGGLFDLLGIDDTARTTAIERANLAASIRKQLGRDKKLFGLVARNKAAQDLARAGNTINRDASKEISDNAGIALNAFDLLKNQSGPIAKSLNAAAERVANGENAAAVQKEIYSEIAKIIKEGNY